MRILGIDPGNIESAYVIYDGMDIIEFGKISNFAMIGKIWTCKCNNIVIEMISSYGMPVGKDIFETCVWIGRFVQKCSMETNIFCKLIYRKEIKMNLCNSTRAKDSNIIQALVDRFGNTNEHGKYSKGTKRNPGFFYGFSKDIWQALAVAVTFYDSCLDSK